MARRGFSKRDVERVKDMRIDGRALLKMELKSLIDSSHVREVAPCLPAAAGVVDEDRAVRHGTRPP